MEETRVLEDFSRYEILETGIVKYRDTGKICPDFSDGKGSNHGYRKIKLFDDTGIRRRFSVHRLVWLAFFGDIPEGFEIDHIDHNKQNNNIDNLRIIPALINRGRHRARAKCE